MPKNKAWRRANKSSGRSYLSGEGYIGVLRRGSGFGWEYRDSKGVHKKGGYGSAEEAAYAYDEFVIVHVGPHADTNQSMGYLKDRQILNIKEKLGRKEMAAQPAAEKTSHKNKTGFKGVSKSGNRFCAQLWFNGKLLNIGTYETAEVAARAYDVAAVRYKGADADTNVAKGLLPPLREDEAPPVVNMPTPPAAAPKAKDEKKPKKTEKVAAQPKAAKTTAPAVVAEPREGQLMVRNQQATDLEMQAARLLQEAANLRVADSKKQILAHIEEMSTCVQGFQEAVIRLVDFGAILETGISELRTMLD